MSKVASECANARRSERDAIGSYYYLDKNTGEADQVSASPEELRKHMEGLHRASACTPSGILV